MINRLFEYSKNNSSFNTFSQRGDGTNLKQGQNNLYYRMCTSNKDFRVGFQQYHDKEKLFLTITIAKDRHLSTVEKSLSAISVLSKVKVESCKDRTGKVIPKSWEIEINSYSIEGMFYLQEMLLSFFENQI